MVFKKDPTLFPIGQADPRICVKVEVDVLGSPSLIVLMVSVDVKRHVQNVRAQELCESSGGRPGLAVRSLVWT